MAALLRVEAPHFVAGIIPRDLAAPILKWMVERQWSEEKIRAYCARKGWKVETVH